MPTILRNTERLSTTGIIITERAESRRRSLAPTPRWVSLTKASLARMRSLAWLLGIRRRQRAKGVRILCYHRVCEDPDARDVRLGRFRDQMDFLARKGYLVLDIESAIELLQDGKADGRIVALSFDDGFRDAAENAGPVMAGHGFSATVFVTTAVADGKASFSWYEQQPPVLSWEEIERLDREGTLRFEAHTVTHPNLQALTDTELSEEISGSKRALDRHLGRSSAVFCYPAGLAGVRERAAVKEAGFRLAVTCEPGLNTQETDLLALHRIAVESHDRLLDFRAKIGGGHDGSSYARKLYRRLRHGDEESSPRSSSRER